MRNTLLSLGAGALLCAATSLGATAAPLSAPAGARAHCKTWEAWKQCIVCRAWSIPTVGAGALVAIGRAPASMAVRDSWGPASMATALTVSVVVGVVADTGANVT